MLDPGFWKKGSLGFHFLGVFTTINTQTAPGERPSPAFQKLEPREEKQPREITQIVPGRTKTQSCQLPNSVLLLSTEVRNPSFLHPWPHTP